MAETRDQKVRNLCVRKKGQESRELEFGIKSKRKKNRKAMTAEGDDCEVLRQKGRVAAEQRKNQKKNKQGRCRTKLRRQPQEKVKHFSSFIWPSLKLIAPPFRRCSAIRRSKGSLSLAFPVHTSVKFLMLVTCLINCPKVAILNHKSPSYAFFVCKKGKYSKRAMTDYVSFLLLF